MKLTHISASFILIHAVLLRSVFVPNTGEKKQLTDEHETYFYTTHSRGNIPPLVRNPRKYK